MDQRGSGVGNEYDEKYIIQNSLRTNEKVGLYIRTK